MSQGGRSRRTIQAVSLIGPVLAIGGLALLGVTWPMWTPQNLFPRVPAFEQVAAWPRGTVDILNWIALGLCTASLVFLTVMRSGRAAKAAALVVAVAFLALTVLDQHRLQPWVVHIALGLLLLQFADPARRMDYLRGFTVSIYAYSALGKFDAQFLHTVGQDFVGVFLERFGGDIRMLSDPTRFWLAAALPIGELLVAIGLVFRLTRAVATVAAIVMHLLLLVVLGPWGLDHAWGVLVWNMLFIATDALLFLWPAAPGVSAPATGHSEAVTGSLPQGGWIEALLIVALVAPLGERLGLVDHWLGWALYAPHSSRVRIEVAAGAAAGLPDVVQPFIERENSAELIWREVRIDRWSLATLGAPVYPQQRFQLGVARALAQRVGEREIRVHLLGTADRWSGQRGRWTLEGRRELEHAAMRFWFNTKPIFAPAL